MSDDNTLVHLHSHVFLGEGHEPPFSYFVTGDNFEPIADVHTMQKA